MSAAQLIASEADAFACSLTGVTATAPDGHTVPLDGCAWMQVAPCGCVSGVTTSVHGDEVLASEDAALRSMSENVADYREDVRNGVRMVLVTWDDYRGAAGELFKSGGCPHTPRYGVQRKTREVGGILWTRIGSARWTCTVGGKSWSLDKYSARWNLGGPFQGNGRFRGPYTGSGKLDDALERCSAYITEHPDGLERVSS